MENALIGQFDRCCGRFAKESGALQYDFLPLLYKKSKQAQGAMAVFAFQGFQATLVYHSALGRVRSVLECRISLGEKGDEGVDFSLYDLLYLLDENDYNCYIFPYIESAQRMADCLEVLFGALIRYRNQLTGIGSDAVVRGRAQARRKKEMLRFFKTDVFAEYAESAPLLLQWQLASYREWYVSRFCAGWYIDYIEGRYERAAKRFAGYDNKSDYELRLLKFIKTLNAGATYQAVNAKTNTYANAGGLAGHGLLAYLLCAALLLPLCFGVFLAFGGLAASIIYRKALVFTSLWSAGMFGAAALCGFVCALLFAYFLHARFMRANHKRKYDKLASVFRSEADRRRMTVAANGAVVLSLVLMITAAKSGVAIYREGIVDNSMPFTQINEPFTQIQAIFRAEDTGLCYVEFEDGKVYSCAENIVWDYIYPYTDIPVTPLASAEDRF